MTLDELKAKVPDEFAPWVDQYGAAFVQMTADELKAWLDRILAGDVSGAYQEILDAAGAQGALDAWKELDASWATANKANAEKLALQKSAAMGVLKIFLAMALAAVGL